MSLRVPASTGHSEAFGTFFCKRRLMHIFLWRRRRRCHLCQCCVVHNHRHRHSTTTITPPSPLPPFHTTLHHSNTTTPVITITLWPTKRNLHVSRMQSETCRSSSALKEMLASHQGTLGPAAVLEELRVELRQLHLSHDHVRTSMEAFATTHAEDATKMHESMSSLRQELQRITVLLRGTREELPSDCTLPCAQPASPIASRPDHAPASDLPSLRERGIEVSSDQCSVETPVFRRTLSSENVPSVQFFCSTQSSLKSFNK